jgi:hypothetical protein
MLEQMIRARSDDLLNDDDITSVKGWLEIAAKVADDFNLKPVHDRISSINRRLTFGLTQHELSEEYRVLRETIDVGLKGHLIYRYPAEKAEVLRRWTTDWQAALKAFPSAGADVKASVDLWAMHHSTASVFHLMRVLEHGLRALALHLEKTFDVQTWQVIIDQIESQIKALSKSLPPGPQKSARLQFLSEVAKEFSFFKDGWRNHVMHNRVTYNDEQARSVMDHVRSFMNRLSVELSEK